MAASRIAAPVAAHPLMRVNLHRPGIRHPYANFAHAHLNNSLAVGYG